MCVYKYYVWVIAPRSVHYSKKKKKTENASRYPAMKINLENNP